MAARRRSTPIDADRNGSTPVDTGWRRRLNGCVSESTRPRLRSVVLDTTDPRRLGDFYHPPLGFPYVGTGEADWVLLETAPDGPYLAFQKVDELPESTWPTTEVPQQLHL